jgi:Bacterial alpha-L-rhamnosidase 6 hairpin glycosidase domain
MEILDRRDFMKASVLGAAGLVIRPGFCNEQVIAEGSASVAPNDYLFTSGSLVAALSENAPEFAKLNIDGLGLGKPGANVMQPPSMAGFRARVSSQSPTRRIEYRTIEQNPTDAPAWTVELFEKRIRLTSQWSGGMPLSPFTFRFDLAKCHSTVLGLFTQEGNLGLPALIHLPGQGSMQLTASVTDGVQLEYRSERRSSLATLSLPAAAPAFKKIVYTLEITAIYPKLPGIANDSRFDPFRRDWLNVMQLNPETKALSNNTASTSCAFCYYEYADIAALTPPLVEGLRALDVVRQTLDRILAGGTAYGLPAPGNFPTASSDTFPSMLIAAANCVRGGRSNDWLAENYEGIKGWAEAMLATDKDGNGLIKYSISGDSGIWPDGFPKVRPSNWWDTIGFGHEDAYANALAYRALNNMANLSSRLEKHGDAARYRSAAEKLHGAYYKTFFDPESGVLGGWRSSDGKLHDYYFLWVNGIAIHYGLVEKPQAESIMDKLMAKMKAAGYDNFKLGLPGNLITVALPDCVDKRGDGRYGCGVRPDNSDGFQNYENGGATGCFAFFTLAALYDLGRRAEADEILFAMLGEYDRGGFEGRGAKDRSNDWRRWDGTAMGYEGFLVDNYYTLLAVPLRQTEIVWNSGYRPMTTLS